MRNTRARPLMSFAQVISVDRSVSEERQKRRVVTTLYDELEPFALELEPTRADDPAVAAAAAAMAAEPPSDDGSRRVTLTSCLRTPPTMMFTDNETNYARFHSDRDAVPAKDAFHDAVCKARGAAALKSDERGSKFAFHLVLDVPAHSSVVVRLRLARSSGGGGGGKHDEPTPTSTAAGDGAATTTTTKPTGKPVVLVSDLVDKGLLLVSTVADPENAIQSEELQKETAQKLREAVKPTDEAVAAAAATAAAANATSTPTTSTTTPAPPPMSLTIEINDADAFSSFTRVFGQRVAEHDAFYRRHIPSTMTSDEALVARTAYAGLLWSKQFYHYVVDEWLTGDAAQPPPPSTRRQGRNHDWGHFHAKDVLLVPDKWEYPVSSRVFLM